MERRVALATAVGSTVTLGLATVCVAAVGGWNILGFSTHRLSAPPTVVTELQTIDDVVVVVSGTSTTAAGDVPVDGVAPGGGPVTTATSPGSKPTTKPGTPSTAGTTAGTKVTTQITAAPTTANTTATTQPGSTSPKTPPATTQPTTTAPRTTTPRTTVPIYTTTGDTLPPGARVSSDWPKGKPVPPIPPNCNKPVLEDNGVWNCG